MQRLLRLKTDEYSIDSRFQELLNDYDTVIKGMNYSLPPTVSSIFSRPIMREGEAIEWYSELQGQAFPLDSIDKKRQAIVYQKLTDRLTSIKRWIGSPQANEKLTALQQNLLSTLVTDIENKKYQVFSVNEEPVVVQWGARLANAPEPVPEPTPAPPPPPPPPARSFRLWPWLLLPLLLLLLALLWWFLTLPLMFESKEQCTTAVLGQEKAKMMVAFDGSGSMSIPLSIPPNDIDAGNEILGWFNQQDDRRRALQIIEERHGPSRMTASKNALLSVIDKIDESVDIKLLQFNQCPAATDMGTFDSNHRAELTQAIQQLSPLGGTPLIDALQRIAADSDPTKDAFALIISDGADSCYDRGNNNTTPRKVVCNIAKDIAQQYPRLKINVLDIAEQGAANCIAEATGGKVFGVSNAKDVDTAFAEAIKPLVAEKVCTTAPPKELPVWKSLIEGSLWDAIQQGKVSDAIDRDPLWTATREGLLWDFIRGGFFWEYIKYKLGLS